ncbi:DUF930 domain-containing protein [Aquamicrobium sp. LC103]|uniref:DUF930 domain-containing protein n=1 Tax=Aquamicrobium sp. LC103 TaxID=1120658 RepID=UPI00063EA4F1|nr:DUF930 domain-containing protein [Aquamicrobium sp. LC103]TKT69309.1 DUF930 domain-containing protein [Aquamicrobium sp. LC103]
MRRFCLSVLLLPIALSPANALDARLKSGLMKLDPDTRLEQRCDVEVLERIRQENRNYAPDRVVAYATGTPRLEGDEIRTRGAAFRSKGQWYRLRFKCQTTPDHMTVVALRYKIGDLIPTEDWDKYYLWP